MHGDYDEYVGILAIIISVVTFVGALLCFLGGN